ncbi:hypothetical protein RchiOBHm_Chr1g0321011 [Rosa chinensis]|uniref:Uncharacterized protein n=1 Tax=Rosa chinensis TaxID=74649 RepID=A0A2P6S8Z5_ROSCH|nr:hypothetical protein RchiOBHm_Chr1g0321011 [Rosa chinensis]
MLVSSIALISIENEYLGKINCDKLIDQFAGPPKSLRRLWEDEDASPSTNDLSSKQSPISILLSVRGI